MRYIPLTSDSIQSQTTELNGVSYVLEIQWNGQRAVWSLDLIDEATETVLAYGISLVLGTDVLGGFGLGIGSMWCLDLSGQSVDAGPDDLGDRVQLVYFAPDEVPGG